MQDVRDPRPVLVAVDASESARDAAGWGADVAADWAAPLHLVHVVAGDPQDAPPADPPSWLSELVAAAERAGARADGELLRGDVVETVVARAVGARLLVLGSYGPGRWSGMLAGTVARGAVDRVACPVAVVRGPGRYEAPPRSGPVVVGVDGSPAAANALAFAADLAASLGARLVAVHTWTDVVAGPGGSAHRLPDAPDVLAARAAATLDEQLAPVVARYPRLAVEREVRADTPLRAFVQHAVTARVLVVGTRGHTGDAGMLMGSTAQALVEFAPCPVVVVHPRSAAAQR